MHFSSYNLLSVCAFLSALQNHITIARSTYSVELQKKIEGTTQNISEHSASHLASKILCFFLSVEQLFLSGLNLLQWHRDMVDAFMVIS